MSNRPQGHLLVGRAGACLVAGLYFLTLFNAAKLPLAYDEAVYLQLARQITETGFPMRTVGSGEMFYNNPPLVPYITALTRLFAGDSLFWLRVVHVTLWALPLYGAIFFLTKRMFGSGAGLLAVASFFTQTPFLREAAHVQLDTTLAAVCTFFLWSLYRLWALPEGRARRLDYLSCATLAGLACLTKYQGILAPLCGVMYLGVVGCRAGSRAARKRALLAGSWVTAGAGVGLLLWLVVAISSGGDFLGAIGHNLKRVAYQTDEPWFHAPLPAYWQTLRVMLGPVYLVAGVALSVFLRGRQLWSDPRFLLLSLWGLLLLTFCSSIGLRAERFFYSACPALAVFIGSLASSETYRGSWLARRSGSLLRAARLAVIVGLVMATSWTAVRAFSAARRLDGPEVNSRYREIGLAIQRAIPTDERVLLSRVEVAYFAERNYFLSQYDTESTTLLKTLEDPGERITLYVEDSPDMFHPSLPVDDRNRLQEYVESNFALLSTPGLPVRLYKRTSWQTEDGREAVQEREVSGKGE
jgi:4-amino-4-deoxy-L-arabinose transferase-like glycosyltransferase